ncbi:MAG: ABC transporter permease, partial [Planctomycetales bacterium]|nr:ABC transporter permease [Planctomycetales bacterium]
LLAITSIIAVGITCFVSMQSAYHNLSSAKTRYYQACRMADFWIDLKKAPRAELAAIAELPGVKSAQSRIQFYATADIEGQLQPINSLVISLPERRSAATINGVLLEQGDYFSGRRDNETIVNAAFAKAHRIVPGDTVHLLLNNRRQELFVVGTAISSEFAWLLGPGALIPDPKRFGVFYVRENYAEDVFDFDGAANQVVGLLAPDVGEGADEVLRRAETTLEPYGVFSTTPLLLQGSHQFLNGDLQGLGSIAVVVPTIFLAVAALVLNVLITRLARQQRTVVGTLKAMGYSDGAIFAHFLQYGLAIGAAGGLLGCGMGYFAAYGLTLVYDHYYTFPDLENQFHWATNLIGMAVSIACAEVGSVYGAWSMLKLQPAAAMRPEPPVHGRAVLLERIRPLWTRLSSSWRMALRGMARNRLRSIASTFAAAMGSALLVSGFMMTEAQYYFLDFEFGRTAKNDLEVTFADKQAEDALWEIRSLPGVARAEPVLNIGCTFVNGPYRRKGGISGISPESQLTVPHDSAGRPIRIPDSGLVLTKYLAQLLHVGPGDSLTVEPVEGE